MSADDRTTPVSDSPGAASNRLGDETSPYLRQHAHQPVHWYPWGDAAFTEARRRGVPLLVSIGYSACHWCHVMSDECFDDPEVAAVMNASFVNVKVDREERPDVDALYMDALAAMTGRGGWPLNVFIDPTGRPFHGVTYVGRDRIIELLDAVRTAWEERRGDIDQQADALVEAIGRSARLTGSSAVPELDLVNRCLKPIAASFDTEHGGFGTAPKFPQTLHLELISRALLWSGSDDARRVVEVSLDAMASGGIYDHLGGGFARYSVDREWIVPHFEKMLYDQAQMVRLYLRSAMITRHQRWMRVVTETIGYVLDRMQAPEGGLYSAEDADSPDPASPHRHGSEGLFYTWTPDEVRSVLGADAHTALQWWGIDDQGHLEGRSIPNRSHARGVLERPADIEQLRRRLLAARDERPRPGLDDKVLTEWNAMFLSALVQAAAVSARTDWADAAVRTGEFLLDSLCSDGRWQRSWQRDGGARHDAVAIDHAWLIDALTRLGELTGQARWTMAAVATADTMLDHFWDPGAGGLFTTADDAPALVVRQKDLIDGATASANSVAASALLRLAALTGERRYRHHAEQILQLLATVARQSPTAVSFGLVALDEYHRGLTEVVVVGDRPELVRIAHAVWRPDTVIAWGEAFDSPLWEGRSAGSAYVCRDHVCLQPQDTPEGLLTQLSQPIPTGPTG
jgi:uncharacterized protein YyaL (SSP411 family)